MPWTFSGNPGTYGSRVLAVRAAMAVIESVCNVRFIPRTTEPNYLVVRPSTGNSSYIGMIGGPQDVNIYSFGSQFIICHELIHALGFWHEHQRPDRSRYVQVNTANIEAGRAHNFAVAYGTTTYGPYDFDSVMHYPPNAFSSNGGDTITVLAPRQCWQGSIGQTSHLSALDILALRRRYGPAPTGLQTLEVALNLTEHDTSWPFGSTWPRFAADANGDGRTDLLMVGTTASNTRLYTAIADSQVGFRTTHHDTPWPFGANQRWGVGDVNGDRRSDFIMVDNTAPGGTLALNAALADGNGSYTRVRLETSWPFATTLRLFAADVNGDARADALLVYDLYGNTDVRCALGTFNGSFELVSRPGALFTPPGTPIFTGDSDGDGRAELLAYEFTDRSQRQVRVWLDANGNLPMTSRTMRWPYLPGALVDFAVTDLNADGRSDFVMISNTGPGGTCLLHVDYNTYGLLGREWSAIRETPWPFTNGQRWLAGDINGDRASDLLLVTRHGSTDGEACGAHACLHAIVRESTGQIALLTRDTTWSWSDAHAWLAGDPDGDRRLGFLNVTDLGPNGASRIRVATINGLPALSTAIGFGCGLSGRGFQIQSNRPVVGQNLDIEVQNGAAHRPGMTFLGLRPAAPAWIGGSCWLYLEPGLMVSWLPFATDYQGSARLPVPLPPDSSLIGASLRVQGFASADSTGFDASQGLDLTLGSY